MRLSSIKGRSVDSLLADKQNKIPHWALRREYRSTYTDRLRSGEKLIAGQWFGPAVLATKRPVQPNPLTPALSPNGGEGDPTPVSLEEGIARDLGVGLGDQLAFDVQGVPV